LITSGTDKRRVKAQSTCIAAEAHAKPRTGNEGSMQLMSRAVASMSETSRAAEPNPASDVERNGDTANICGSADAARDNVIELNVSAAVSATSQQIDDPVAPESIELQVRAAMVAAAKAVIEPWLEANFGRTVERCLSGRLQKIANEMISSRLLQ
jgi:hypothetical protein